MSKKILVVDDDPMIHRLLEFSLKNQDFSIDAMLNGEAAKKYLASNHHEVNAMILDWEMPGISGLDLLKWLKKNETYKHIPVVMLTGHTEKENIQQGIDAGALYYLTKPFNKEYLSSILNAAISDYLYLQDLSKQVSEAQNPFYNLQEGAFKLKNLKEAQRLSVYIANASDNPEKTLIICELFINAIEHGNLGISYLEKTRLIDENKLAEEIEKRLNEAAHSNKFASVKYGRDNGNISILIEDEGGGFDFEKYLAFDENRVFDNHGRGIAMANSLLNIKYLGKGNAVEVRFPASKLL